MIDLLPWASLFIALIAGAVAITSAIIHRGEARSGRREPTWQNLVNRVTDLETAKHALEQKIEEMEGRERRKMGAVLRVLRAIAEQWPTPTGPDLDREDIALIEETLPPQWIRPRKEAS